jgi:hypothetical protein
VQGVSLRPFLLCVQHLFFVPSVHPQNKRRQQTNKQTNKQTHKQTRRVIFRTNSSWHHNLLHACLSSRIVETGEEALLAAIATDAAVD